MHELADAELQKLVEDSQNEIRELRFQFGVARSLQNPSQIRNLRRTVAGALTVLNLRKLGKATQKAATQKAGGKEKKKAEAKPAAKEKKKAKA